MKPGDLVKMKDTHRFHKEWGPGFIISVSSGIGFTICVLFPELMNSSFDGLKWCQQESIEVISETE